MKLEVLKYAQAILPNLFEGIGTDPKKYVIRTESYMFNDKLCHDEEAVKKYIMKLNKISDCDSVINEFRQLDKLLNAAKIKGINLMDYGVSFENKKKLYQKDKYVDCCGCGHGILMLDHWKNEIRINYDHYILKNQELLNFAIAKRSELAWKIGYVRGFYNDNCVAF